MLRQMGLSKKERKGVVCLVVTCDCGLLFLSLTVDQVDDIVGAAHQPGAPHAPPDVEEIRGAPSVHRRWSRQLSQDTHALLAPGASPALIKP